MTKEEAIDKAIELEFGSGNAKNIREHNSSLVKVAEHLYDLMHPSLSSNMDGGVEAKWVDVMNSLDKYAKGYDDGVYDTKATAWKPNKEQIDALWKLMHYAVNLSIWPELEKPIESLMRDLKKLEIDAKS